MGSYLGQTEFFHMTFYSPSSYGKLRREYAVGGRNEIHEDIGDFLAEVDLRIVGQ